MNLDIIFFDSWGGSWTPCPSVHPDVEAVLATMEVKP